MDLLNWSLRNTSQKKQSAVPQDANFVSKMAKIRSKFNIFSEISSKIVWFWIRFENVSPATRLLEKRRQMYEVQDALAQKKANFLEEDKHFQKEERALREKDSYLQKQLIRFNKFLQDNEAKRKRAETRAAEEKAQIHIKVLFQKILM